MSSFSFSKVVIIQSLDAGDCETGTKLAEYIDELRDDAPSLPPVQLINVEGRDEFLRAIEALTTETEQTGVLPILQIETHGWQDHTGLAFPDNTSLDWSDMSGPLARLNKATEFNLLVCMSACFGGHSLNFVKPDAPSPCFALIGPTHSIGEEELLGSFRALYGELLVTLDANAALRKLHAHNLDQGGFVTVTAEDWFFKLAEGYLKTDCTKDRLLARGQAITDQIKKEGKSLSQSQLLAITKMGETLAGSFLDRRFPTFFMVPEIPGNRDRFGETLTAAKQQVKDFMSLQK